MKLFIYFSFSFLLISSCSNDDNNPELICSVENPIEDLDWLKSEIDVLKNNVENYDSIIQSIYKNQIVFIFNNCNPVINSIAPVKNCSGERIGILGSNQGDIPFNILEIGTIIWKPDNFKCNQ